MQRHVLAKLADPSLVVEAIWTPILASDRRITADARGRLPDPRVRHWWDAERWAQKSFREPLKLPAGTPAWDVYLVYAPGLRWGGSSPPAPTFFMHQLKKLGRAGHLHGPTLATAVERALAPATAALDGRCTLAPDALSARKPVVRNLLGEARATRKLADGVALDFDRTPAMRKRLDDFVAFERGCCGHLTFAVRDRRRDRRIELAVTSPDPEVRAAIWQRLERR